MSFPHFIYLDIVNEKWEDSEFHKKIEQRFLLVVFRKVDDGDLKLEKIGYWNMPYGDREEARKVWEDTKRRVMRDPSDLPKSTENRVAHVRTHGKNGRDTLLTPRGDKLAKKGFWLNSSYIASVIRDI